MSDTVKHSDDEEIVTLTYTWGQVKNFLHEHGRPATTRNAEALVAACGRGNRIENGMDSLFNGAYDEVEGQLYEALTDDLPDKSWYDRPNGEWVYDREEPADHHDEGEDEPWYGTYCHIGKHSSGNQCWCCNTCSQCGRHMCESCTVRCGTCGSIVCDDDAHETTDGEWECVECKLKHDPERNPSRRTTCAPCSGRAVPSGHWCEKSTACPHPRKNMETVEKQQAKTSRKYHNTVI